MDQTIKKVLPRDIALTFQFNKSNGWDQNHELWKSLKGVKCVEKVRWFGVIMCP